MTQPAPEVLFLAHRIPYPPDRGDRIRSWHLLRALAARAPVHCGCLIENTRELAQVDPITALTASHCYALRPPSLGWAGLSALLTGRPVSQTAFSSARLARWVRQTLAERPIGTIFVFSGQMAQFVPADFRGRVVMDFVDVDSAKFAAYAAAARTARVRAVHAREARLLSAFESRAAHRADLSLLITAQERDLFASQLADPAGVNLAVLGNGIDAGYFSPDAVTPEPSLAGPGPYIVFTGQMDYAPNIAAVTMFAHDVMPLIRARHAQAQFAIVGREPAAGARALDGVNGTRVTGQVDDVRPWLAAADLVVAPLLIARGVQNKVLEAMAMARPVLLTPAAATGVVGEDGVHFAVEQGAGALAARAIALLDDAAGATAMGAAARALVIEKAGWDTVLAPLPAMMGWGVGD
ncbi:TIGR03087 family PEP-CTERM/XrtA system glycosyltransferase [Novosphingobium sp.]|uniref:TIGR03087 family PEP-CTERM/XrtA system glycosyltransferase n=1 Tax=Novosphingobium sp. TaxID=1874826 RepID=UPI00333E51F9